RRFALAASIFVVAGAIGGGWGGSKTVRGPSLPLYSGQPPQTTPAPVAPFERQTGIHVNERDGDEASLAEQIQQEGSRSPADVFYAANSPSLVLLQGKGLLASTSASVLSQVSPKYDSPQGDWVGVSA